ncbi:hypothetical protein SDC9_187060 [bioreactor metagenome]|uniref:Uncharacterized protein n=1 Tax=bioreactor metagenome TaxID=1076179 RepID=A0A645HM57_9ZZZZ
MQLLLYDPTPRNGAAHHTARNQAIRCRGDSHGRSACHAEAVFQQGTECAGSTMAAHQRNRTHAKTKLGVQTKDAGQAAANQIL